MIYGKVITKHYFFDIVKHEKAGELEIVSIFGLAIFERVGCYKSALGFCFSMPSNKEK